MSASLWITATPTTPNGELHVGHLAGPYVAADVLRRFLKADGLPVRLTGGLADHESAVELCALGQGRKAAEVADGYGEAITVDWRRAGVEFDQLVRPNQDKGYRAFVTSLFRRLHADGVLVPRTRLLPYCGPCERALYGKYVKGGCPSCGAQADGNLCQTCARPNDCGDLLAPVCVLCGTPAVLRQCRRLYLPLEAHRKELTDFWDSVAMPPRLAAFRDGLLHDGLPDVAVSHPAQWGIEVPVEGFADQRIAPAVEEVASYLLSTGPESGPESGLKGGPDNGPESGPENGEESARGPLQFFGIDRAVLHLAVLPTLVAAYGGPLPTGFQVNEYYRLDGRKLSTTRRHAVWALDVLTDAGSDTLRRHVLSDRPEGRPAEFELDGLDRTRDHLHTSWNQWLSRLFAALREDCAGVTPEEAPGGTGWDLLAERLDFSARELRSSYGVSGFAPRRAVALLDEVVRLADDFHLVNAPERDRAAGRSAYRAALAAELAVACALTAWAWPVMPEGAGRLAAALGVTAGGPVTSAALAAPAPGVRLVPPTGPVFGF
ncbi:class I tRNA ligase family protein [Saccharothrix sp. ST-888]|uniref:class I tRNA ligase family protein n=1 Tax=Saccharothrix sp. ST-888 TaxID=1427391 RepID=UPI0005EC08F0|nr:class I tRNA ligase family protein [Saccharothrix sp. ST-888]KJK55404.1 methionyl-tRNA synthetase [Saccharothrix sp. ST-888]